MQKAVTDAHTQSLLNTAEVSTRPSLHPHLTAAVSPTLLPVSRSFSLLSFLYHLFFIFVTSFSLLSHCHRFSFFHNWVSSFSFRFISFSVLSHIIVTSLSYLSHLCLNSLFHDFLPLRIIYFSSPSVSSWSSVSSSSISFLSHQLFLFFLPCRNSLCLNCRFFTQFLPLSSVSSVLSPSPAFLWQDVTILITIITPSRKSIYCTVKVSIRRQVK